MRSFILALCAIPSIASAHPSVASGPGFANKSQIIMFNLGHGCTDAAGKKIDTVKIEVTIPTGVTSVRGMPSGLGTPTYTKSGTNVTKVAWTKPITELEDGDTSFYQFGLRAKLPDTAFAKLQWTVTQTCEDAITHQQIVVPWDQPEGSTTGEPARTTVVVKEELKVMSVDYVFTPTEQADWYLLLRNKGQTDVTVQLQVELFGNMIWTGIQ